jgi:hypothetical protein
LTYVENYEILAHKRLILILFAIIQTVAHIKIRSRSHILISEFEREEEEDRKLNINMFYIKATITGLYLSLYKF